MSLWLEPLLWFAGALVVAAFVSNGPWRDGLERPLPWGITLYDALRSVYLMLPLLLAVGLRVLSPGSLGLGFPPAQLLPWLASGLAVVAAGFLLAVPLRERHAAAFARARRGEGGRDPRTRVAHWGRAGIEALQLELHWAFVRAAALTVGLPRPEDSEPGINLGASLTLALLLLALEAAIDPRRRAAWVVGDPRMARQGLLATLSMLLFALGPSSLLPWLAHWLLRGSLVEPTAELGSPTIPAVDGSPRPHRTESDIEPTVV